MKSETSYNPGPGIFSSAPFLKHKMADQDLSSALGSTRRSEFRTLGSGLEMTNPRDWYDSSAAQRLTTSYLSQYHKLQESGEHGGHLRSPLSRSTSSLDSVIRDEDLFYVNRDGTLGFSRSLDHFPEATFYEKADKKTDVSESNNQTLCNPEVNSSSGSKRTKRPFSDCVTSKQELSCTVSRRNKRKSKDNTTNPDTLLLPEVSLQQNRFPENQIALPRNPELNKSLDSVYFSGHYEKSVQNVKKRLLGNTLKYDDPRPRTRCFRSISIDKTMYNYRLFDELENKNRRRYSELLLPRHEIDVWAENNFRKTYNLRQQSILNLKVCELKTLNSKGGPPHDTDIRHSTLDQHGRSSCSTEPERDRSQKQTLTTQLGQARNIRQESRKSVLRLSPRGRKSAESPFEGQMRSESKLNKTPKPPTAVLAIDANSYPSKSPQDKDSARENSNPSEATTHEDGHDANQVKIRKDKPRKDDLPHRRRSSGATVVTISLKDLPKGVSPSGKIQGACTFPTETTPLDEKLNSNAETPTESTPYVHSKTEPPRKIPAELGLHQRSFLRRVNTVEVFGEKKVTNSDEDEDRIGTELSSAAHPPITRPPLYKMDRTMTSASPEPDTQVPSDKLQKRPQTDDKTMKIPAAVNLGSGVGERTMTSYKPKLEPRRQQSTCSSKVKTAPKPSASNPDFSLGPANQFSVEKSVRNENDPTTSKATLHKEHLISASFNDSATLKKGNWRQTGNYSFDKGKIDDSGEARQTRNNQEEKENTLLSPSGPQNTMVMINRQPEPVLSRSQTNNNKHDTEVLQDTERHKIQKSQKDSKLNVHSHKNQKQTTKPLDPKNDVDHRSSDRLETDTTCIARKDLNPEPW